MSNKLKVLTISDHVLSPSGVGHVTKDTILGCLNTGRFSFLSLCGAIRHESYTPMKVDPFGDDWICVPVDGFGTQDIVRSALRQFRPDVVWIVSDPRFYSQFFWLIEHEIRRHVPLVYYHVWDSLPTPHFNRPYYISNDLVVCISKLTHQIVKEVAPEVPSLYLPHAVDPNVFKPLPEHQIAELKQKIFGEQSIMLSGKMVFFWNNRNASRKMSGALIWWFNEFLKKVGRDKAVLVLHTDTKDPNGTDLEAIVKRLGITNGEVLFSTQKYPPEVLATIYNIADCTLNISHSEGFGLSSLESLSCGKPIIVTMTGGLQEQVTDGKEWFGIGLKPVSEPIIGSLEVPYISQAIINQDQFVTALETFYHTPLPERQAMGEKGRQHVLKNYNFQTYQRRWVEIFEETVAKHGSWGNRKNYKNYRFEVIK
jgi:glycosyltransferase involved in cell wall biosynthesis